MKPTLDIGGNNIVGHRQDAGRALWPALAIATVVTALRLLDTVEPDVAWQLWIAGRMHAGAHLYRDIIEVNPPLWFWIALPIDALARALQVRPDAILIIGVGAIAALSLVATERLLRHLPAKRRLPLLGYFALVLAALPWVHVGQREQIVLITTLPYAALIAARMKQRQVQWPLAALIGLAAAIGFALKPHFLIVPIMLDLWLFVSHRRDWQLLRPEVVAIVCVGIFYASAITIWSPEYLKDIVPLVRLTYGGTGVLRWLDLFHPFTLVGLATLAFALAQRRRLRLDAPVASAVLIATIGFTATYFIQSKGWFYQSIPLVGCASLALASLFAETAEPPPLLQKLSPALLALPLMLAAGERKYALAPTPDLSNAISGLKEGETVAFLTADNEIPWSVTLQHRFRYPSRYMSFWMLNAIANNEQRGNPDVRLASYGRQVVAQTVEDLLCNPPARIIVSRPPPGEDAPDVLPFFLRDPRFAEILSHYRERSRTTLATYDRKLPLPPPGGPCRTGA